MRNDDGYRPDYYSDDPVYDKTPRRQKAKKTLSFKLILLAIISAVGYSTLGSTFAANVQLGTGVVEFGQGVQVTTACAPALTLTPYATFANATGNSGAYRLTTIDLTGFGSNCYGKDLIIRAYDSVTANALVLYQTGGTTNYDSIRVYRNSGYHSLAGSGLTSSEITSITDGFRITLFNNESPTAAAKAAATSVYRFTVESVEHDASLSQSSLPSGSMIFNGSTSRIQYPANNAFKLGTGAFTVELWAKLSTTQSDETFYDAGANVNNTGSFAFWIESNMLKIRRDNTSSDISVAMNSNWRDGSYHHFVAVRGNNFYRIFVDGVMVKESTDNVNNNIDRDAPIIGTLFAHTNFELSGDIRNFRLVKGTALYSANFTPPTVPLSKVSGTLILLLAQDSNNPTKDSSDNQWAPTNSGNLPAWRAP